jgi:hypothetical protein
VRLRTVARVDLQPDAIGVGEEDAAGAGALAVRHDPAVVHGPAQMADAGLRRLDLVDRCGLECQVVQAGPVAREVPVALLPQRQHDAVAVAEEREPLGGIVALAQHVPAEHAGVERQRTGDVGNVQADMTCPHGSNPFGKLDGLADTIPNLSSPLVWLH